MKGTFSVFFFFQAEDGIRDVAVTGVQTCALPILLHAIEHDVQPEKFGTIPAAMWWAIVTLGTVGYGDVVPVTPLGKVVSVFTIVGGLTMIALPVAIISTASPRRQMRSR